MFDGITAFTITFIDYNFLNRSKTIERQKKMNTKEPPVIYHLRVKLKFDKRTYRDILIRDNQSFEQLHQIIFTAFDRYEEHLYSFSIKQPARKLRPEAEALGMLFKSMGIKTPHRNLQPEPLRIISPECGSGYEPGERSAANTKLGKFKFTPKQKFAYLFDFGDEWQHEIEVIGTVPFDAKAKYPCIIKVNGASPDQYPDPDEE